MADQTEETNPFVLLPRGWSAGKFDLCDVEAQLRKVSPTIFVDPAKARSDLKALYEHLDLGELELLMPTQDTNILLDMPDEEPVTASEVAYAKAREVIEKTKWLSDVPKDAKIPEQNFDNPDNLAFY